MDLLLVPYSHCFYNGFCGLLRFLISICGKNGFVGIEVLKTATVGELKMAVEAAFSHLPNTGPGKISWYIHHLFLDLSLVFVLFLDDTIWI